jgi:Na+-driven multidrug efflux pump
MVQWGIWSGVVLGAGLAALAPFLGPLFSPDPAVHRALVGVLLLTALAQPLAGVVFVLDGVLIGAGDGTYLAWAGLVVLVVHAPATILAADVTGSLLAVWAVLVFVFMGARAAVLVHRARGERWMVTGATT